MPRTPGQFTLLWIHFGIAASAIIRTIGGFLPLPFGSAQALAASAALVQAELEKKQKDQEGSMKK